MAMIYDPLVHYQKNLHRIKNVKPDYYRQIELLADESEGVLGNISSSTAVSIKVFHNKKTCQRAPVASSLITRGRGRTPARGYLLEGANEGNKSQLKEEVPPLGGLQLVVSHVGHLEVVTYTGGRAAHGRSVGKRAGGVSSTNGRVGRERSAFGSQASGSSPGRPTLDDFAPKVPTHASVSARGAHGEGTSTGPSE